MAQYKDTHEVTVDAFEYGVDPRPAWFDQHCKNSNYNVVEPPLGYYVVLFHDDDRVMCYNPDAFEYNFEPIFN